MLDSLAKSLNMPRSVLEIAVFAVPLIFMVLLLVLLDRLQSLSATVKRLEPKVAAKTVAIQKTATQEKASQKIRLKAADFENDGKKHLLLCATGSVATIKIPDIIKALVSHKNLSIRIIFTESAREFLQQHGPDQVPIPEIEKYKNVDGIYFNEDEWAKPWVRGDSILHIELRRWADIMVVAPLSANSLAKIALGLSDDLFSSVCRAWDTTGQIDPPRTGVERAAGKKTIIVAPAMNTAMWEHPITAQHVAVLERQWGVKHDGWIEVLRPKEGTLACGDVGSGAMKDWKEIVAVIEQRLSLGKV